MADDVSSGGAVTVGHSTSADATEAPIRTDAVEPWNRAWSVPDAAPTMGPDGRGTQGGAAPCSCDAAIVLAGDEHEDEDDEFDDEFDDDDEDDDLDDDLLDDDEDDDDDLLEDEEDDLDDEDD